MTKLACAECEESFERKNARQKFCSDPCRYRAKDRARMFPCAHCGEPMHRGRDVVPGISVHNACSSSFEREATHGTPGAYRNGCRCDECLAENSKRWSEYRKTFFAEHGEYPDRMWIDPEIRISLYERDGWMCKICDEPVDREAKTLDRMAPTLDHIIPRSHQLVPDHSPENLRTAHRWCNSARGNRI